MHQDRRAERPPRALRQELLVPLTAFDQRTAAAARVCAFSFLGIGAAGEATDRDGDNIRDLNDLEYQCSSAETLITRFVGQGKGIESELVLVNLTGGRAFEATLDFLAYNDNEEAFSGQIVFQCRDKLPLLEISQVFSHSFLYSTTHDLGEDVYGAETGWLRINGNVAQSTAASLPDPAFLAMLVERIATHRVADLPFETGAQTNGDLLPLGVLGDLSP